MVGPAGGGMIFDTNALHRGDLSGERSRATVVLEFHPLGKVPRLRALGLGNPCPSFRTHDWRAGIGGLSQYRQEADVEVENAQNRSRSHHHL